MASLRVAVDLLHMIILSLVCVFALNILLGIRIGKKLDPFYFPFLLHLIKSHMQNYSYIHILVHLFLPNGIQ